MKVFVIFSLFSLLACSQAKQEPVKAKAAQQAANSEASDDKSIPTEEDSAGSDSDSEKSADSKSADSVKDKVSDVVLAASKAKELSGAFDLLKNAAASNLSCDATSDCSVIEYGFKACGGPEGYLVLSKKNIQVASGIVNTLSSAYTALSTKIQEQSGAVSNCSLQLPPTAVCEAKVCVKK